MHGQVNVRALLVQTVQQPIETALSAEAASALVLLLAGLRALDWKKPWFETSGASEGNFKVDPPHTHVEGKWGTSSLFAEGLSLLAECSAEGKKRILLGGRLCSLLVAWPSHTAEEGAGTRREKQKENVLWSDQPPALQRDRRLRKTAPQREEVDNPLFSPAWKSGVYHTTILL